MKAKILTLLLACTLIALTGCSKKETDLKPVNQLDSKKNTLWTAGDAIVAGRWKFTQTGNTNKSVCTQGNSTLDGAPIHQWFYRPTAFQNWDITVQNIGGTNYYKFINVGSGKALASPGSAPLAQLVQKTPATDDKQLWTITHLIYGVYKIINKANGMGITLGNVPGGDGTALVQAAISGSGQPSQQFFFKDLSYPVDGARFKIYNPIRNGQQWYINDHTFIQHTNGIWHLLGITRKEPADGATEISFAHATETDLTVVGWNQKDDIARHPSENMGGWNPIWAPHIVHEGGVYYMFYSGGISTNQMQMRVRTSTDLYNWSAPINLFTDGRLGRDPRVMRIGTQWVMYYCATENPNDANFVKNIVAYRVSNSLTSGWSSSRYVAFKDYATDKLTESPFVIKRGSYYYLFRCWGGYPGSSDYEVTDVYRSTNPFEFLPFDKVGVISAHAAEIIQDTDGKWYASHCGPTMKGVFLEPLTWFPN